MFFKENMQLHFGQSFWPNSLPFGENSIEGKVKGQACKRWAFCNCNWRKWELLREGGRGGVPGHQRLKADPISHQTAVVRMARYIYWDQP